MLQEGDKGVSDKEDSSDPSCSRQVKKVHEEEAEKRVRAPHICVLNAHARQTTHASQLNLIVKRRAPLSNLDRSATPESVLVPVDMGQIALVVML